MYPYNGSGGLVPMMRGVQNKVLQHDTDIDRLMRLLQQQSEGEIFGGDPTATIPGYPGYNGSGSGGSGKIWEGQLTTALTRPTNGWTGATFATVAEYDENSGSPGNYIATGVTFTITNRDKSLYAASGTYCHWVKITTVLGNTEYRICWIGC